MILDTLPVPDMLLTLVVVALAVAASFSDVRSRRIPNVLPVAGLGCGVVLHAMADPAALPGVLVLAGGAFVVGLGLFAARVIGAGDAKLMIAFAALLGPDRIVTAALWCAVAGGVIALVAAARAKVLIPLLLDARDLMVGWAVRGGAVSIEVRRTGDVAVPYGVAISAGALMGWFA